MASAVGTSSTTPICHKARMHASPVSYSSHWLQGRRHGDGTLSLLLMQRICCYVVWSCIDRVARIFERLCRRAIISYLLLCAQWAVCQHLSLQCPQPTPRPATHDAASQGNGMVLGRSRQRSPALSPDLRTLICLRGSSPVDTERGSGRSVSWSSSR